MHAGRSLGKRTVSLLHGRSCGGSRGLSEGSGAWHAASLIVGCSCFFLELKERSASSCTRHSRVPVSRWIRHSARRCTASITAKLTAVNSHESAGSRIAAVFSIDAKALLLVDTETAVMRHGANEEQYLLILA